jgi:cysteine desulfurase
MVYAQLQPVEIPTAHPPVYLDHAATTTPHPDVVASMLPYCAAGSGNPSSLHRQGRIARQGLDAARRAVAGVLQCRPGEILFTSGGSEADNLAIRGVVDAYRRAGHPTAHVISTPIEHHAVGHTLADLAAAGVAVTLVPVDRWGRVAVADIAAAIRPDTCLISVMYANNEVGTVQPIRAIGALARARGIPFHTDAVQAGGSLPLAVDDLGVDLLALSAHKFYGPKGVGLLYVRAGTPLVPQIQGGGQEHHLRAGTENVAGIVGLAAALLRADAAAAEAGPRIQALRDRLIQAIQARIPDAALQGHPTERLANNAAFCFAGVSGPDLVAQLDTAGICASSGSACNAGAVTPSHVLAALGVPEALAGGALRLTLGAENTAAEIDRTVEVLVAAVQEQRVSAALQAAGAALVGAR